MNILLVCPHPPTVPCFFEKYATPPLGLQQLAAVTPKKHTVKIIDERFEGINYNKKYDLVGITTITASAIHAYEIADKFRKRGMPVILGGYHASVLPDEAKQHADSVVIGEADLIWPNLLQDLEKGKLRPFYKDEIPVDPTLITPPDRNASKNRYILAAVQATRGCPIGCEFCTISNLSGGKVFRKRPVENVINEIKSIKHRALVFYDASLTIDPSYAKDLFKEMKGLKKKFSAYGNINSLGKDDELLELSKEAGCTAWFIGFESINQNTINSVGKSTNIVEEYGKAIKKIKSHGISVIGSFMFGLDTDTPDVFDATLEAIEIWEIDSAEFSPLTPYPGTSIFRRFEDEGRILTKDWSLYTCSGNVLFQPKNMTIQEFLDGIDKLEDFYSMSRFLRRVVRTIKLGFSPFLGIATWSFFTKAPYVVLQTFGKRL